MPRPTEEFVAAGEFLTYKFPVWSWCVLPAGARALVFLPPLDGRRADLLFDDPRPDGRQQGDPSKIRDFLPADKQYLITRNVPCLRRAKNLDYAGLDEVRRSRPRRRVDPAGDAR